MPRLGGVLSLLQMYSDLLFSIGLGRYMRTLTRVSPHPTFFYLFSFDGRLSVVKKLVRSELPGNAAAEAGAVPQSRFRLPGGGMTLLRMFACLQASRTATSSATCSPWT